ncbi:MAG: MogA/MoaB family molybdenum cofactor biosynthesis protein [Brevinema sp.]
MKIAVITSSDRAFQGAYPDISGQEITKLLREFDESFEIDYQIVPDELDRIYEALLSYKDYDWIITTGGTGIAERDVTPEATQKFCEKEIVGISEYLRRESFSETPFAVFSRGYAGYRGTCIVVNLPGSVKGAGFCTKLLLPLLVHGTRIIHNEGH